MAAWSSTLDSGVNSAVAVVAGVNSAVVEYGWHAVEVRARVEVRVRVRMEVGLRGYVNINRWRQDWGWNVVGG